MKLVNTTIVAIALADNGDYRQRETVKKSGGEGVATAGTLR
jgi:hypothetical protein